MDRGRSTSELVAGVDWVPYGILEGEGTFEVLEDAGLLDEIAALKEAPPRGPSPMRADDLGFAEGEDEVDANHQGGSTR